MAQETPTGALYQSGGMEWEERWKGVSKGREYLYTYGWFMLRFDRKQQNSMKQLSFNKKQINLKKTPLYWKKKQWTEQRKNELPFAPPLIYEKDHMIFLIVERPPKEPNSIRLEHR